MGLMKLLIIGDSHGHIANLKHVMGFGKKVGVGGVIHVGDWDDPKSVETVLEYKIPLYSVLGNADIDHEVENLLFFNCKKFDPNLLSLEIDGRKIGVMHQVKFKDKRLLDFQYVFSGHRHSRDEKMVELTKFICPGALINGINFAIFETVTGDVEFIND